MIIDNFDFKTDNQVSEVKKNGPFDIDLNSYKLKNIRIFFKKIFYRTNTKFHINYMKT